MHAVTRRLLLAATGALLGLAVAEAGLRLRYPALPSVAPLAGAEFPAANAVGPCDQGHTWRAATQSLQLPGRGPILRIRLVGDSTTAAVGVDPKATWWHRLGRTLAGERPLDLVNVATPGQDFCGVTLQTQTLPDGRYDLLLVGVFADDLVRWQRFSVGNRLVLLPHQADPTLRPLVSHAYVANLTWLALEPTRTPVRARSLRPGTLARFEEAMRSIAERAGAAGAKTVFVLHPPSGFGDCPPHAAPDHGCGWMARDLDDMAGALQAAGLPIVDLRETFQRAEIPPLPQDLELMDAGRLDLPIHVAAEGQAALADEIVRQLRALGWNA